MPCFFVCFCFALGYVQDQAADHDLVIPESLAVRTISPCVHLHSQITHYNTTNIALSVQHGIYFDHSVVGLVTKQTLGICANNLFLLFYRFLCAWGLDDFLYMGLCNVLPCKQKLHHDFMLLRIFYSPNNNIPLLLIYVPGHKKYWQVSSNM